MMIKCELVSIIIGNQILLNLINFFPGEIIRNNFRIIYEVFREAHFHVCISVL